MNESLQALRDPDLDLLNILCQLILDIRRIIMHPDLQVHVKLAAIQEAVDELAPPPGSAIVRRAWQPLGDPPAATPPM